VSIAPAEVDEMLLREFATASFNNRRTEMDRLARRAVDKVYAEFALLGFTGFAVRMGADGVLVIEGTPARDLPQVRP
jgi:hypothetical protein